MTLAQFLTEQYDLYRPLSSIGGGSHRYSPNDLSSGKFLSEIQVVIVTPAPPRPTTVTAGRDVLIFQANLHLVIISLRNLLVLINLKLFSIATNRNF